MLRTSMRTIVVVSMSMNVRLIGMIIMSVRMRMIMRMSMCRKS